VQKTYCDRCGTECVNYTARFDGTITHTTSQGEIVAEDDIRRRELCLACSTVLIEEYGFKVISGDVPEPEELEDPTETVRAIQARLRRVRRSHPR
jgi:hypothetical protein